MNTEITHILSLLAVLRSFQYLKGITVPIPFCVLLTKDCAAL